ncbi:MAG: hypothetical protein IKJ30_06340 [Bacilli bacterium]|nr:hypothetical protein [Bacilli bacterium]
MCKSKKTSKLFSLFATFIFVLFLFAPVRANAAYEPSEYAKMLTGKNQFVVDPTSSDEGLVVTIQYKYKVKDLIVVICEAAANQDSCKTSYESAEIDGYRISVFKKASYDMNTGSQESMTETTPFSGATLGSPIRDYANGKYKVYVSADVCELRSANKQNCSSWINDHVLYFDEIEIKGAFTGNADVNNIIADVLTIVNNYVIPVLWVAMGILLIVRGVILAIGIIKASDEAEVRSNKIKGLVWLVIGVFAGFVMTIGASWIMSVFGYGGMFS